MELKLNHVREIGRKMADFPRRCYCYRPVLRQAGRQTDRQTREKLKKRKVRHDRRRWSARCGSRPGFVNPFENTLLATRRYVLHAPRAILQLRDALVYFAHHRHRRTSPIFILYSCTYTAEEADSPPRDFRE